METGKKMFHPVAKEFRKENCGFSHSPPDDFVRSQWQRSTISIPYLIYRWIVAAFFTGVVIVAMIAHFMRGRFFIYFTNWGIILCMVTNIVGAVLVSLWYFHPKYSEQLRKVTTSDQAPIAFKIYWALHTTTLTSSIAITIIYWGFLYSTFRETIPVDAINIFEHVFNSVLMVADLIIVAFPIRIYHVFWSVLFTVTYAIFSYIYYAAGGVDEVGNKFIYPILDWEDPGRAMITVVSTAALFAMFPFILFALYKLRVFIHARCNRRNFKFSIAPDRYSFENRGFHNDGIPRTSL